MRASIYNPYLDTMGGGERYTLSFAKVLVEEGWSVDMQWSDASFKNKLEKRFGLELTDINFVDDIKRGDSYDLCFWVGDGSIPTLRARNNILHFQIPFTDVGGRSLLNKMKLIRINNVVRNSNFTKKIIDNEYGVKSVVVYPPVDVEKFKPKRKKNIILYVGRFSSLVQNKGQDILIKQFRKMVDDGLSGWELILAGGVEVGAGEVIKKLKKMSQNLAVRIIQSPSHADLVKLYSDAKFFWSASGFGADEAKNPEKMEHFGITTVEAMAAGCVPVVFNGGGQKEIIENGKNGFLWHDLNELANFTDINIKDTKKNKLISSEAIKSSAKYSYEVFKKQVIQLL